MNDEEMAAALKAKGWTVKAPITQENCEHPVHMQWGSGTVSTDGSSHSIVHCTACGMRREFKTSARPTAAIELVGWN